MKRFGFAGLSPYMYDEAGRFEDGETDSMRALDKDSETKGD